MSVKKFTWKEVFSKVMVREEFKIHRKIGLFIEIFQYIGKEGLSIKEVIIRERLKAGEDFTY